MTDTDQNADKTEAAELPTELSLLKDRATALGLEFHTNIGLAKLKARVNEHITPSDVPPTEKQAIENAKAPRTSKPQETPQQAVQRKRKYAHRLRRVNITCMDTKKREWTGEIFTASNSVVGTLGKFVQFNTPEGWHVPQIILNMISERRCQVFINGTDRQGRKIKRGKLIPEFTIIHLDDLTPLEARTLATKQAMAAGSEIE